MRLAKISCWNREVDVAAFQGDVDVYFSLFISLPVFVKHSCWFDFPVNCVFLRITTFFEISLPVNSQAFISCSRFFKFFVDVMLGYISYFFYISVSNLAKYLLFFGDLLFFGLIKSWVLFHVIYIFLARLHFIKIFWRFNIIFVKRFCSFRFAFYSFVKELFRRLYFLLFPL